MSTFNIYHEWLHDVQIDQPERAAQAEISILVNEICLTENEDRSENTSRQFARLSALHLSEWFATNWWRLLWEPYDGKTTPEWQMSHKIGAADGGYLWPDLSFISDWNTVLVRSSPTVPRATEPIHYTVDYNHFIQATSFEQGIDHFVYSTIDRLAKTATKYTDLAQLWSEVVKERNDPQFAAWRKLEACLGYEPDEGPTNLLEDLQKQNDTYGINAVQELAAASKSQALEHLHILDAGIRNQGIPVRVHNASTLRDRLTAQPSRSDDPPWQRATRAAQIAREVWSLGRGPIQTHTLSELFGFDLSVSYSRESDNPRRLQLSAGMRDDHVPDGFLTSFNQRYLSGRRFTLARLVADYLEPHQNDLLLPATFARTSRQKFQRAFAQEFLCPFDELTEFLGVVDPTDNDINLTDDDINDAAWYFEVSPLTIKITLVNKGVIERDNLPSDWAV
jgi:hypothetical protein